MSGNSDPDYERTRLTPTRVNVDDNNTEVSFMSSGTNITNMTEPEQYNKADVFFLMEEMRML